MGILSSLACLPWLDGHWNLIRMRAGVNDCAESVAGELSWTGPVILGNDRPQTGSVGAMTSTGHSVDSHWLLPTALTPFFDLDCFVWPVFPIFYCDQV